MNEPARHHRPVRRADLTTLLDGLSATEPFGREEVAEATAAAVISHGRSGQSDSLVDLADRVGLQTLAELWRDSEPDTLAGALWALYLLRTWCQTNGEEVTRLWRAGRPLAPADEVVAGVADFADPQAILSLAESVLSGAYRGDFAVALERAAAFFRIVSLGRIERADDGPDGDRARELASRNAAVAAGLTAAARRWRAAPLD
ncbi:hypothetical protein M6D93_10415 [Jatrophihabitans telluris]|uniref:Uncharacterized protein n=1 Tax=Jatrophihabitans telluris TaxID=2038343 RepID=A0ABY4QUS2_9ACTN|nr:hypothetical protein [Jatrophihabitans telluris]UQX86724.1 hypothetical protein M6D93_10415 [Jatrophihabitans telluris]